MTIVVFQILSYIIGAIPLRLLYRGKRVLPDDLHRLRRGSLLISNHQSMVDPFYVLAHLPLNHFLRILPIRFPTDGKVYASSFYNPKLFPILTLLGCFSVGVTKAEKMRAIFYIRGLLKKRETVFLFPEGEIIKERNVKDLKRGIDFFIDDALNVLFVRISGLNGVKRTLHDTVKCTITFGEVFEPPPSMSVAEMQTYLENL